MAINEASTLKDPLNRTKVATLDHHIYVSCVSDSSFIDCGHPRCNCIASGNCIANSGFVERLAGLQKS